MKAETRNLIDCLAETHCLPLAAYEALLLAEDAEARDYAAHQARTAREPYYGKRVFVRGLIEFTNICANDCLYCGIRRNNRQARRYRLSPEDILACCAKGYRLGFRTFVLQGGEDPFFGDELLCGIVARIRAAFPDCAITLSVGERSRASYRALFEAGANRYLLRHETADAAHYAALHPPEQSWADRMACLDALKAIGFQTGCGFMVGSPGQTPKTLAADLKYLETFRPAMCGIGPFIPHRDTPFAGSAAGRLEQTLYLLSLARLIRPNLLLPATTALGSIHPRGRELGMLAGANVLMPNLSPPAAREKYTLYDNKLHTGDEVAQNLADLAAKMTAIGYEIVKERGDALPDAAPNAPPDTRNRTGAARAQR